MIIMIQSWVVHNCTGEYVPKDHKIMTMVMIVMVMNVDSDGKQLISKNRMMILQ